MGVGTYGTSQDDLMSDCHYGGVSHALDDPHGLLFCAEGDLDYALLRSPPLYRRFADRLHHLLTVQLTAGTHPVFFYARLPSRGTTGPAGVFTRPAGLPHPWGATS